jgi:Mce-associated membrane protein
VVQVFVDMNSRSRQTPEGVTATAAYTVTLNRAADWTITDVGGVTPDLPAPTPTQAPR